MHLRRNVWRDFEMPYASLSLLLPLDKRMDFAAAFFARKDETKWQGHLVRDAVCNDASSQNQICVLFVKQSS